MKLTPRSLWLCLLILALAACAPPRRGTPPVERPAPISAPSTQPTGNSTRVEAGGKLVTYVNVEGIGKIAVEVALPQKARYAEGAGVVVEIPTFLTERKGFYTSAEATQTGLIHVALLWPGLSDPGGARSEGTYDHAREKGLLALREVIKYAAGKIPDVNGKYLKDSLAITPLPGNLGLYAFSHPGLAATRVLALYGNELPEVAYFVGRENPTVDTLTAVEVGYWDDDKKPVLNPLYVFPRDYSPLEIKLDYSTIRWDGTFKAEKFTGRPYFDLNHNGVYDPADHALNYRVPSAFGKRLYSAALTRALLENGALSLANWPTDVATPDETSQWWPFWNVTDQYAALQQQIPNLKIMLVFADHDHVQPALDKPHLHQAYAGFHNTAGLWTRLNPDASYARWANPTLKGQVPDNAANTEPADWLEAVQWAYTDQRGAASTMPLAALAEMADRVYTNHWEPNLAQILMEYPAPVLKP